MLRKNLRLNTNGTNERFSARRLLSRIVSGIACGVIVSGCGPGPSAESQRSASDARSPLYRFANQNPGETKVRLGRQHRTVLAAPLAGDANQGSPIAQYMSPVVQVPGQARLDFGMGLELPENARPEPVTFTISVNARESTEEIYSRTLQTEDFTDPSQAQWVDESIDLSSWAGKSVSFYFSAVTDGNEYQGARWAAPVLYSAGARPDDALPNLLIICLDTLRADHLGCYGYSRDTTPNLDRFAAQSFLFEDCFAQSSWTTPSHATLFTGLSPAVHGAGGFSGDRLRESVTTLSELAADADYLTAAFTEGAAVGGRLGFYQGFDVYSDGQRSGLTVQRAAERTFQRALNWMERYRERPFIMFLHTYEIHWPYAPPEPYANMFTSAPIDALTFNDEKLDPRTLEMTSDPEAREIAKNLYDGGIAYTDALLGNLFERMEELELFQNTVIVVLSDHGEGFWEHGIAKHGTRLYREVLHVPLIVRLPGQDPPAGRIPTTVALADMFPTMLEWLGIDHPKPASVYSLNPLMNGARAAYPRRTVGAHLAKTSVNWLMISIQDATGKYIVTTNYANGRSPLYGYQPKAENFQPGIPEATLASHLLSGEHDWWTVPEDVGFAMRMATREELFRYPGDSMERINVSADDVESLRRFRQILADKAAEWKAQGAQLQINESIAPLTEEELEELRAMGYVH